MNPILDNMEQEEPAPDLDQLEWEAIKTEVKKERTPQEYFLRFQETPINFGGIMGFPAEKRFPLPDDRIDYLEENN